MLTLTLPVVVTNHDGDDAHTEKLDGFSVEEYTASRGGDVGRLVEFEEEGVGRERTLVAAEDIDEDEDTAVHELKFNKWLMATQCTLGPLFCVSILFCKRQFPLYHHVVLTTRFVYSGFQTRALDTSCGWDRRNSHWDLGRCVFAERRAPHSPFGTLYYGLHSGNSVDHGDR